MEEPDLKYKIALTLLKGIGTTLAKNLIAYTGSAEGIFHEKQASLALIPGISANLAASVVLQLHAVLIRAEEEIEFIRKNNIRALSYTDKAYPYRLKECPDSPVVLYQKGDMDLNRGRYMAIVGTRNATEYGKDVCQKLIHGLAHKVPNLIVVSGLAYGVDICAHKAALESSVATIGVVGHGLDRIYPALHRSTAVKMLNNGCILTEYLSNTNPDRPNFVQRNRIIAGLCDVTVVIESACKGGALITAELANDYNRDVFAFPGRVGDEYSAGCNQLIRNNKASLITSDDDLIRLMNWDISTATTSSVGIQATLFPDLSDEEMDLLSAIRKFPDGVQVNALAISTGRTYSRISSLLLEMEFKGLVRCMPGSIYKAVK